MEESKPQNDVLETSEVLKGKLTLKEKGLLTREGAKNNATWKVTGLPHF